MVVLYSAGGENLHLLGRQAIRAAIGFTVLFLMAQVSPRFLFNWSPWLYLVGLALLVMVLVVGEVAQAHNGGCALGRQLPTRRARQAHGADDGCLLRVRAGTAAGLLRAIVGAVLVLIPTLLIAKQPDLGTSLLIACSGGFVLFLAGMRWRLIVALGVLAASCAPVMWYFMHDYQRRRVLTFMNPERDPLGDGYHIIPGRRLRSVPAACTARVG